MPLRMTGGIQKRKKNQDDDDGEDIDTIGRSECSCRSTVETIGINHMETSLIYFFHR